MMFFFARQSLSLTLLLVPFNNFNTKHIDIILLGNKRQALLKSNKNYIWLKILFVCVRVRYALKIPNSHNFRHIFKCNKY